MRFVWLLFSPKQRWGVILHHNTWMSLRVGTTLGSRITSMVRWKRLIAFRILIYIYIIFIYIAQNYSKLKTHWSGTCHCRCRIMSTVLHHHAKFPDGFFSRPRNSPPSSSKNEDHAEDTHEITPLAPTSSDKNCVETGLVNQVPFWTRPKTEIAILNYVARSQNRGTRIVP